MKLGNVMIFGDSYSTYAGYIPKGYAAYYSGKRGCEPDVFDVKNTWWGRLIDATESNLVRNDSWSGSTVGFTGYNPDARSFSFITRFEKLLGEGFFDENTIDTLFVFGGTNDSWSNAPLGELKFGEIEESELYSALPAISYFGAKLKEHLANARIIFIANSGIKAEIVDAIRCVCEKYGFEYVALSDVDKLAGHPTERGMEEICEEILAQVK